MVNRVRKNRLDRIHNNIPKSAHNQIPNRAHKNDRIPQFQLRRKQTASSNGMVPGSVRMTVEY